MKVIKGWKINKRVLRNHTNNGAYSSCYECYLQLPLSDGTDVAFHLCAYYKENAKKIVWFVYEGSTDNRGKIASSHCNEITKQEARKFISSMLFERNKLSGIPARNRKLIIESRLNSINS